MLVNFFKWNLAWKEKHAIRTCIFKDWNPGGGEGWKALLLCTASWNQTQIKADFSQECEALSDGWIPHVSHLHHQIPASVSTSTGYHTAVPTATSAIRNWKKKLKKKITETHQTSRSASLTTCLCKVPLSLQISTTLHISDWKQSPSPNVTVRTTPTTFSALSNPLDRSITKDIFYSSAQHSPPSTLTGSTQTAADFSECIQLCLMSLFL